MEQRKELLEDLNSMKVITILLVVLAHVTRMYTPQGAFRPLAGSNLLETITLYIYSFHMPAFVAISGAIYFYVKRCKNRYDDPQKYIINKAKRLLIPYFFFACLVVLPTLYFTGLLKGGVIVAFVKKFLLGTDPRHLWFLTMLFFVFVIFDFWENRIYKAKIGFNLIFLTALNVLSFHLSSFLNFHIHLILRYMLYFYIGYAYFQHKRYVDNFLQRKAVIFVLLFSSVILFFISQVLSERNFPVLFCELINPFCALAGSAALYVLSCKLSQTKIISFYGYNLIKQNGFGLYLFHPMIIYWIFYLCSDVVINPYLLTIFAFLVSTILSLALTEIFRMCKLGVFIGE